MLLLLLLAVLLAAVIGANSSANCVGPAIGGRVLTYRKGVLLATFFALLGLFLEGPKMLHSVGGGILLQPLLNETFVTITLLAALLSTALATRMRFPISTSHSIALAVIGAALVSGFSLNTPYLSKLFLSWLLTPVISAAIAIAAYRIYDKFSMHSSNKYRMEKLTFTLLLVTIAYTAYALGANTGGFLISLLSTAASGPTITILPAIAFASGLIFLSRGIIKTVGSKITQLGLTTAMAAQLAAAVTLHIFTEFGIPVSQSQAVVGGIVGVGLAYGTSTLNIKKLRSISLWWVLTPSLSFLLAYLFTALLSQPL